MLESYSSELVREVLNGQASDEYLMVRLLGQVLVILVGGLVLWRAVVAYHNRKNQRRKSAFRNSKYQSHWRK